MKPERERNCPRSTGSGRRNRPRMRPKKSKQSQSRWGLQATGSGSAVPVRTTILTRMRMGSWGRSRTAMSDAVVLWVQSVGASKSIQGAGAWSMPVINPNAGEIKLRRIGAQLCRAPAVHATKPGSVDRVPAWLVAASAVRSPATRFSSPVEAEAHRIQSRVNSERFSLAVALDTQYFAPICRDYDDLSQRRDIDHACHDWQLDLFEVGDVAF